MLCLLMKEMAVWLCSVFSVFKIHPVSFVFYDFELLLTSASISYFTQAFSIPFPVLYGIEIAQFASAPHMFWPSEAQPVLISDLWINSLKCFQWRPGGVLYPGPSGLYVKFRGLQGASWEHSLIFTWSGFLYRTLKGTHRHWRRWISSSPPRGSKSSTLTHR